MDDSIVTAIKPKSTLATTGKKSAILFQGEVPNRGILIKSGVIRAYTITSEGEERTVGFYTTNDFFPIPWLFGETSTSLFYYETITKVSYYSFSKQDFLDCIQDSKPLLRSVVFYLANQYTALLLRITGLEQGKAIEKLGFTLYYLLFKYGKLERGSRYIIDIKLSQAVIASMVGNTRETTSSNLHQLRQRGIIEYTSFTYIVDKKKLEDFLGEDSFRELTN